MIADQQLFPDVASWIAGCDPARTALIQHDRTLSYGALNANANQVACYLRSLGVGPGSRIGVSIKQSIEFVVAALGILKCGAAYVPLDQTYPEPRRRMIVEDAGLELVLTAGQDHEQIFPWPMKATSLRDPEILDQDASDLIQAAPDPQQVAYVIYTSGSTGVPKGVEVTRANLRHLIDWHNGAFQVTSRDRATLIANVGFDASVWELWPHLCAGATLLIPAAEIIRSPEALRDWLLQMDVTIMFAPTLLAEALIAIPWPQHAGLRFLLAGGDTLRNPPRHGLPFRLINNYGPAECTVVSTSGEIPPSESGQKVPSIGRPIPGIQILLLDEELREVSPGSAGEICILGNGVARGYLNRPELTAQRFVRRNEDAARLYRSGDLGRLNEDGSIQFLGRLDEQVKVRGYRIECGEVEAALNSLPSVQTSAVVLRQQQGGHQGLTAYVVLSPGADLGRDELRQGLRSLLPEYMLPEQFVRLSRMPISDNGKIDRRNLPAITEDTIIRSSAQTASPIEAEVMTILGQLLKIDQIEPNDDFFLLGGHSFVAAQLIARVRNHYGVDLSLRAVFENPTPVGIAQQIERRIAAKA